MRTECKIRGNSTQRMRALAAGARLYFAAGHPAMTIAPGKSAPLRPPYAFQRRDSPRPCHPATPHPCAACKRRKLFIFRRSYPKIAHGRSQRFSHQQEQGNEQKNGKGIARRTRAVAPHHAGPGGARPGHHGLGVRAQAAPRRQRGGEIIRAVLTPANTDDRTPLALEVFTRKLFGRPAGDKGYISQVLSDWLLARGTRLVTWIERSMESRVMEVQGKLLPRQRAVVETVIGMLKHVCQVEHTRCTGASPASWPTYAASRSPTVLPPQQVQDPLRERELSNTSNYALRRRRAIGVVPLCVFIFFRAAE